MGIFQQHIPESMDQNLWTKESMDLCVFGLVHRFCLGLFCAGEDVSFMMLAYTDIRTAWPPLDCVRDPKCYGPTRSVSFKSIAPTGNGGAGAVRGAQTRHRDGICCPQASWTVVCCRYLHTHGHALALPLLSAALACRDRAVVLAA